jgi:hypothetical protein
LFARAAGASETLKQRFLLLDGIVVEALQHLLRLLKRPVASLEIFVSAPAYLQTFVAAVASLEALAPAVA